MKRFLFCIILVCSVPAPARVSVAVFPLQNNTGDPLLDWVGSSIPESFYRKMQGLQGVQVWDPVFLFQVDSLVWRLEADSVLARHQRLWKWDIAVGGSYCVEHDTVLITLAAVKQRDGKSIRKVWRRAVPEGRQLAACAMLLLEFLATAGVEITAKDSTRLLQPVTRKNAAYAIYAAGLSYEMRGERNKALSAYLHAVDKDDSFGPALYRIGMLHWRSGDRALGGEYLSRAESVLPEDALLASRMADFLMEGGEPDKAAAFVGEHRSLLASSATGMTTVGKAYLASGEYQRALAVLMRAAATGPCDLETDFTLGRTYMLLGQFAMAADIFGRLIEYRPLHTRYYSFLGVAYRRAGSLMESSGVLERAMRLDSLDAAILANLANTYHELGWYKKAEQLLVRAITLDPGLTQIYVNLGVLYWHMKRPRKANDMFHRAAMHEENIQAAVNNQANMLLLSGDLRRAIRAYRRADKAGEKSEAVLYNLASVYLASGRLKDAAVCFEEVLFLSPDRLDVQRTQADIMTKLGMIEDAELCYRKLMKLAPADKVATTKLVCLLEEQDRCKEAVSLVEDFLGKFPQDHEFRLLLPRIYRRMGWHEVAVMEYERLSEDDAYRLEPEVFLGLGCCLYDLMRQKNRKDYDRALRALEQASQLMPANHEPDMIIGFIYRDYKYHRGLALDHWQEALSRTADHRVRGQLRDLIAGVKE